MKNIVVASDLSERSEPAVQRAINLAAASGARLTVVHVVDDSMPSGLSDQLLAGANALLSDQVAQEMEGSDVTTDIKVVTGDVFEAVNEVVDQTNADLLVVGIHRRRKFFDQVRETTVEHIIRSSSVPVLLAMAPGNDPYVRVLGGVDLSKVCAATLHKIGMVAPKAELNLFHAHEISFRKEAERDYETWQAMHVLPENLPPPTFVEGTAVDALHELMDGKSFDLLAIGAHTRSNAGRYILGSLSAGLIRNPPCDLMLAK
ncbi:universal stress protein [Sulfitobacter sp. JB4-11]|uniref:universal stress protein n=1 Tax=Sulfitobacter rhodophyticola TaxID=3238304 RepID=UPI003510F840